MNEWKDAPEPFLAFLAAAMHDYPALQCSVGAAPGPIFTLSRSPSPASGFLTQEPSCCTIRLYRISLT